MEKGVGGSWVVEMAIALTLAGVYLGLPLGFVALRGALVENGLFADLCAPGALMPCNSQLDAVDRTFTAIVLCGAVGSLPLGIFMDWMGPARANKYVFIPGAGLSFALMSVNLASGWMFVTFGCLFAILGDGVSIYASLWLVPHALRNRPEASLERWMSVGAVVIEVACVLPVGFVLLLGVTPVPLWLAFTALAIVLTIAASAGLQYVAHVDAADEVCANGTGLVPHSDIWLRGMRRVFETRPLHIMVVDVAVVLGVTGGLEVATASLAPAFGLHPTAQRFVPLGIAVGGLAVAVLAAFDEMHSGIGRFAVKAFFAITFLAIWYLVNGTSTTFWVGFAVACA